METERHSPRYNAIEAWSPGDILEAMIEGQFAAVAAVRAARPALEKAALAIEPRLRDGGRLAYAGAGTSGRLAVQDGAELMPTFSWPQERLLVLMAGGRSPWEAFGWTVGIESATIAGGLATTIWTQPSEFWLAIVLAHVGGSFVYLSASGLRDAIRPEIMVAVH